MDAESGLIYLRARYYDPATGQLLSRDPESEATRSVYGYSGQNPLTNTDPSGLCKHHSGITGFIRDKACQAGDVATGAADSAATTAKIATGLTEFGATYVIGAGVNFLDSHLGLSAVACLGVCVGIEYQNGNLALQYGIGDIAGLSASLYACSHLRDPNSQAPIHIRGFGPISEGTDHPGWSFGSGPGDLIGNADLYSTPVG